MNLVDTHCHLHLLDNPGAAICQAQKAGVNFIISPSLDDASSLENIKIAKKHPGVFAAIGIQPNNFTTSSKLSNRHHLQLIEDLLQKGKEQIVAIGETGLDFASPPAGKKARSKKEQVFLFKEHIKLALKYHLPLIIHNRKANKELISILKPYALRHQLRAVFHCFSGSKSFLKEVIGLGFYLGIGGLVTYDQGLQKVIEEVPKKKLVLETDAPFLTPKSIPEEKRWPNQPKYVKIIAQKIADIRGDSFLSIAGQTTQNAQDLFQLNK